MELFQKLGEKVEYLWREKIMTRRFFRRLRQIV